LQLKPLSRFPRLDCYSGITYKFAGVKDYQRTLFPYAYNILGSSEDARDAIQDVMVKYIASAKKDLENEAGYLIRGVINQSINIKKRKQRMAGDPLWLPEPVATEKADTNINRDEIISYSMLVLLEHLNPKERAAFILKEAFDYSHEDIAQTLSMTVENSRKLLSRAKQKLGDIKESREEAPLNASAYLNNYIAVIRNGDIKSLEKMLSEEVAIATDGGGKIKIVSELSTGIQATMDLVLYVYNTYQQALNITPTQINHQPALLFHEGDQLISCQVFELEDNSRIRRIYSIVDPEKLKNIAISQL
jgi:RNA polymerase sigma factor (sigma-70 family)